MHEEPKIPGFPSPGHLPPFQNRRKHSSHAAQRQHVCIPGDREEELFHETSCTRKEPFVPLDAVVAQDCDVRGALSIRTVSDVDSQKSR